MSIVKQRNKPGPKPRIQPDAAQQKARDRICRIVEAAGGIAVLTKEFGITPQAINDWCKKATIPMDRAYRVSDLTKGRYTPNQINSKIPKGR